MSTEAPAAPSTNEDVQKLAAQTALSEEAKIHLRAAAAEASVGYPQLLAVLTAIRRELDHPAVGEALVLTEETAFDLKQLCDVAEQIAQKRMLDPIFQRVRGERPHGSGPSVTFSGDRLSELFEAMAAAHYVVALVSDGEHKNIPGGRDGAKAAHQVLSPFTEQLRNAVGIGDDEEYNMARRFLEGAAGGEDVDQ